MQFTDQNAFLGWVTWLCWWNHWATLFIKKYSQCKFQLCAMLVKLQIGSSNKQSCLAHDRMFQDLGMSKYFYWISKFDKIIPTCSEDKNNIQIQFPAREKFPPDWMHDLLQTQNFLTLPCRFFSKILLA